MRLKFAFLPLALFPLAIANCDGDDESGGNGGSGGTQDSGAYSDVAYDMVGWVPECGVPGDLGNELGIGQFCLKSTECKATAPFCTAAFLKQFHYCTALCDPAKDVVAQCGQDTICSCGGGGCGCTPIVCEDAVADDDGGADASTD
jgi:hypothetical protein